MEVSIIFSGFGGQGVLFAGQFLAYAALASDKHVTWIPSYGPEMRGGTAHCTVVIGPEPIASPLVSNPDYVVAFNLPSVNKYETLGQAGRSVVGEQFVGLPPYQPERHSHYRCASPRPGPKGRRSAPAQHGNAGRSGSGDRGGFTGSAGASPD